MQGLSTGWVSGKSVQHPPPPSKIKEQRSSYYSLRGQSGGIWRSRSAQGTFTHGQSFFFLSLASATKNEEKGVYRIHKHTYSSGTRRQRSVGKVGVGEVRDHEKRVARVVRTLEKATILLPSQCCRNEEKSRD